MGDLEGATSTRQPEMAMATHLKAFCVGQAKSGTASVAGLLSNFRTAHEPERTELLAAILRRADGRMSRSEMREFLVARDQRLQLDCDIAWPNQFILEELVEVFPQAKFLVLIRDPHTWIKSMIGHLVHRDIPPEVRGFLDWWLRPEEFSFGAQEERLRDRGLYSLGSLLAAWTRHVDSCERFLPPQRRLVLRTHQLGDSHARMADFLGIPMASLAVYEGRRNVGAEFNLEEWVSSSTVEKAVQHHCGAGFQRYLGAT